MAGAYDAEENLRDARGARAHAAHARRLPKPTVARVQGAAFGGGVGSSPPATSPSPPRRRSFCLSEVQARPHPRDDQPVRDRARSASARRARYFLTAERFDAAEALAHRPGARDRAAGRSSTPRSATIARCAAAGGPAGAGARPRHLIAPSPTGRSTPHASTTPRTASPTHARLGRGPAKASPPSSRSASRDWVPRTEARCSRKILIANRGEIACRVIAHRAAPGHRARSRCIPTPTPARATCAWPTRRVRIGPAPARESYLRGERILDAAQAHRRRRRSIPGYGFLSENADFAEACAAAGIVFIGPPAAAIRAMGYKAAAKALMEKAGVPLVPGYHGDDQDAALARSARPARIGYPVLIKASAGGGGKGMRVVDDAGEFAAALAVLPARGRATPSATTRVLIEKLPRRGRATSRSRCSPTRTATASTCSSATARCSAATRRCSRKRRRRA